MIILLAAFSFAFFEGVFIGNFVNAHLQDAQLIEISKNMPEVQQYLENHPSATSIINERLELIEGKIYSVWIVQWFHRPRAIEIYIDKSNLNVLRVRETWVGWN